MNQMNQVTSLLANQAIGYCGREGKALTFAIVNPLPQTILPSPLPLDAYAFFSQTLLGPVNMWM
jgi:hypothetical protein